MLSDREQFKLNYGFSQEFLDETKNLWEPFCNKELSYEEASELANNIINVELFLQELKEKA